jgi:DegV family protein with EDD domain
MVSQTLERSSMSTHKIAIVTDSTAYLPEHTRQGLDLSVIPVWLIWDGENFRDGVDIEPAAFYRRLQGSKTLPTSSQPSSQEFGSFFQQVKAETGAEAIVSVLVSSKISGTICSAQAAAAEHPELNIRIVDSLSCAMGLGFIALAAARAAARGRSVDEVVAAAEQMRARTHILFVVDTLDYLFKGGRISGAKHLLGTALNIKPILHFQDGQIRPLTQSRSKPKAIAHLLEIVSERLAGKKMAEAAVMDVNVPAEGDALAELVRERFGPQGVHRAPVSPVVGTHVGPGTVGLAFYGEE